MAAPGYSPTLALGSGDTFNGGANVPVLSASTPLIVRENSTTATDFDGGSGVTEAALGASGAALNAINPDSLFAYDSITFANAHTITRIGVVLNTAPVGCSTYASFGVYINGTPSGTAVALTSGNRTYDSGAISISVPSGAQLQLGVTTAEAGCSTKASYPVETVVYQ